MASRGQLLMMFHPLKKRVGGGDLVWSLLTPARHHSVPVGAWNSPSVGQVGEPRIRELCGLGESTGSENPHYCELTGFHTVGSEASRGQCGWWALAMWTSWVWMAFWSHKFRS